jgi:hypothetical protein
VIPIYPPNFVCEGYNNKNHDKNIVSDRDKNKISVVHYLQMCMKEYGCCPKFKRGDNSTYTFTKRGVVYLVSTTPPKRLIGVL